MQEGFLADLKSLGPDLCVTAAYGNYLPSRFLAIPPCGNLSLLFSAVHYFTTTFFSIAFASFSIVMNLDLSLVFRTSSNLVFFICVQNVGCCRYCKCASQLATLISWCCTCSTSSTGKNALNPIS